MTFPHDASQYQMVALIGKGASSEVYQAHCLTNDRDVAIKLIDLDDYSVDMEFLRQEVAFWSSSQHANIVEYYGSFLEGKHLYILMEFLSGGSVYDIMRFAFKDGFQDEMVIATILKSITEALAYIHQNGQIHRDIKPGNAIIGEDGTIKIGDFGLARVVDDPYAPDLQNEAILTRWYRAPEVLLNMKNYGSPMDIWSVGCVLAEMMLGRVLFQGQSNINMLTLMVEVLGSPTNRDFKEITNPSARKFMDALPVHGSGCFDELFQSYDRDEVDLLRRMLTWNPERRITVEEILRHQFLQQFHDPFDEPVAVPMADFEFEKPQFSAEDLKRLLWSEVQKRR